MNNVIGWSLVGAALAFVAIGVVIAFQGLRSGLRPLLIFVTGWGLAFSRCLAVPRTVLGIALVIASGAGLQLLFVNWEVLDEQTLLLMSIVWQAVMATAIAVLAVPLHLSIIHDFLADRRFGADTPFYRGDVINRSLHPRPPKLPLLLQAGAFGFLFWLLSYGISVGTNALIFVAPESIRSVVPDIVRFVPPDFVRLMVFLVASFASFMITSLVILVRPALSLGSKRPFLLGVGLAFRNAWALYFLSALLLFAPALVGLLISLLPRFVSSALIAGAIADVTRLIFSIFQTLAVESATLLFMNRAMNQSAERADAGGGGVRAAATP